MCLREREEGRTVMKVISSMLALDVSTQPGGRQTFYVNSDLGLDMKSWVARTYLVSAYILYMYVVVMRFFDSLTVTIIVMHDRHAGNVS